MISGTIGGCKRFSSLAFCHSWLGLAGHVINTYSTTSSTKLLYFQLFVAPRSSARTTSGSCRWAAQISFSSIQPITSQQNPNWIMLVLLSDIGRFNRELTASPKRRFWSKTRGNAPGAAQALLGPLWTIWTPAVLWIFEPTSTHLICILVRLMDTVIF